MATTQTALNTSTSTISSNTMISPQRNSADRIRSRFLHKIGIEQLPPTQQTAPAGVTGFPTGVALSCLGEVTPFSEPLKVGLDSDSSSMEEDEDFYFGDDEDNDNAMEYTTTSNQALITSDPTSCMELTAVPASFVEPASTADSTSTQSTSLPIVSDEGSSHSASQTSLDSFASASSWRSTSTGKLQS